MPGPNCERQLDRIETDSAQDAPPATPRWQAVIWRLADLDDEDGHAEKAVAGYRKAVSLTPEQAPLHLAFAATLWRAKRTDEAEAAFAKALSLAKGASDFQNQIGKVWQTLGEHGKARDAFAASVAAAPGDVASRFNLAVARQLSGDAAGAVAEYEAVLRMKPDLLDAAATSRGSWPPRANPKSANRPGPSNSRTKSTPRPAADRPPPWTTSPPPRPQTAISPPPLPPQKPRSRSPGP